jgi:hypothetical protein
MPTRYLKPGIRDSETIDSLSPLAETLFYRLLVTVDDFGRYDGRPAMIKAACFPIKDINPTKCAALLDELHSSGLVYVYTVDGKPFVQMRKWDNIPRAKESKYPEHSDDCTHLHTSANIPRTDVPLTETETKTQTEKKPAQDCAPLPDGLDVNAWQKWTDFRKAIKKPMKEPSIPAAMQALAKHGLNQMAVVDQSIANGWQGLFALKPGSETQEQPKQNWI